MFIVALLQVNLKEDEIHLLVNKVGSALIFYGINLVWVAEIWLLGTGNFYGATSSS
jgi:hypothetical protein